MIQYDDIDRDDMMRYWGRGAVFLPSGANPVRWNAYGVLDAGDRSVTLGLLSKHGVYGQPDKEIVLSKKNFFEQVMLHRPPLGVVTQENGAVYLLSWRHADGNDLCKAIRPEDVHVQVLEKGAKRDDEPIPWEQWFADHMNERWTYCRDRIPPDRAADSLRRHRDALDDGVSRFLRHPRLLAENGETRYPAVTLVLEYLNQTPRSIRAAVDGDPKRPAYLSGTAWLRPAKEALDLMTGPHKVATIATKTGKLIAVDDHKVRALVGNRLYQALS